MVTVQERIKSLEKAIYDGDLRAQAELIGELHEQWDILDEATRHDILTLEAIFLSIVNARVKPKVL